MRYFNAFVVSKSSWNIILNFEIVLKVEMRYFNANYLNIVVYRKL